MKKLENLAILGAPPAFSESVHVGRPNVPTFDSFSDRVRQIFDARWLSNNGPLVQELERKIANYNQVKNCILMCNGTVALEIAIRACDLEGEVIIPSFTFVATAHALQWQKITPVFCDIKDDLSLDIEKAERLITPKTTGIIGVHLFGQPCDVDAITEFAENHRLKVIFDAAHSFACSHRGRMIGGFGNAEIFSFHATKFFNTFEGGAVLTNDDDLARRIRLMKNFGFDGIDNVVHVGTNGKMSEISAAMGLALFDELDPSIEENKRNYYFYAKHLQATEGLRLMEIDSKERCNYQYVIAFVDESHGGLSRDALISVLHAENILARRYFYPGCHRMEPYRSLFPLAGDRLPVTEKVSDQILVLPNGRNLGEEDISNICDVIRVALAGGEYLRAKVKNLGELNSERMTKKIVSSPIF